MESVRHILNEEDIAILDSAKESIVKSINELLSRNVRRTNIEIELIQCIKNSLKPE